MDVTNTVTGYPEMSYFISKYFMPNVNTRNKEAFARVNLYTNTEKADGNFQYLFSLQGEDGSRNPADRSLFNVQTLQMLCALGENVTNVIDSDQTFGVDFDLLKDPKWVRLSETLRLSIKQTYLVWLWMETAWD